MNAIKEIGDRIARSPMVIPIFFVLCGMFLVGIGIEVEDYTTSYLGYSMLPMRNANPWTPYLVALIPQLCGVGFAYLFARNTNNKWHLAASICCFLIDMTTDVVYKSEGLGIPGLVSSILVSLIVFIFLGKTLLVLASAELIYLFPHFLEQIGQMVNRMSGSKGQTKEPDPLDFLPNLEPTRTPKNSSPFVPSRR